MRAVLDVGQFVSATIVPQGHPAQILRAWREGRFELVTSAPILEDLRRVLFYPRIRRRHGFSDEEIQLFIDALALAATVTAGDLEVEAVPDDPTDDKVLACALEAEADYVVASDEHLISLGHFRGIPIVPPRQFLEILQTSEETRTGEGE